MSIDSHFIISIIFPAAIIEMFTIAVSMQYAGAVIVDKATQCNDHLSEAVKCSQKDNTPFLLPFP